MEDVRDGLGVSPMMGALAGIGLPGTATSVRLLLLKCSFASTFPPVNSEILQTRAEMIGLGLPPAGWLYMNVADKTIELPMTNAGVTR